MTREHDRVALTVALLDHGLESGDVGVGRPRIPSARRMSVHCFSQASIAVARWNPSFSGRRWARQCGAGSMSFDELSRHVENS